VPDVSFDNLFIVVLVAAAVPLALGYAPRLRLPSVVIELCVGIVLGPAVLGWVRVDLPVQILALIGLAFLLFLSGLEIETRRLRGRCGAARFSVTCSRWPSESRSAWP
jgi:Kef-type K+ transport system membrane component KefB